MIHNSRRLLMLFLFFFVTAILLVYTTSAQDTKNVFIADDINISEFPEVEVNIRAIDGDNKVIPLLTSNDIVLYENEQTVSNANVGTAESGPVYVIFVLDMGMWSNLNDMSSTVRASMLNFIDDYFRDNVDTVAIMAQQHDGSEKTITILEPTQSTTSFTNAVNRLDFDVNATHSTEGLLGVETAVNRLSALSEPGHAGTAVIYVSRSIERPQQSTAERNARILAASSLEKFTPIYTFHTYTDLGEPLEELTDGSGGQYIYLSPDHDNNDKLRTVYESIMDQGIRYSLSYRSNLDDSGTRTIVAAPFGTPAELATHAQTYNISLAPPIIEIQDANNESKIMREVVHDNNTWSYKPNGIDVVANLTSWPDGHERKVESVIFTVGGEEQSPITNPSNNSFSHHIDISDITSPKSLVIKVTTLDELGIKAESNSFTINIDAEPPPPTPTPVPTKSGGNTIRQPEDPCDKDPRSPECLIKYIPIVITGIALVAMMIAIIVLWRKLGSIGAVADAAGSAVNKGFAGVKHTILGGGGKKKGVVLAKLYVIVARRDLEGGEVKIYANKTSIGRDPRLCDILLYDEDEVSSVSGVHCTIQYDMGQFLITDDNSSNGTEINGTPLPANNPKVLNDGDEIILGDMFHRGAKFRFDIVATPEPENNTPPPEIKSSNDEDVYGGETILDWGGSDDVDDSGYDDDNQDTMFGDEHHDFNKSGNETNWLEGLE